MRLPLPNFMAASASSISLGSYLPLIWPESTNIMHTLKAPEWRNSCLGIVSADCRSLWKRRAQDKASQRFTTSGSVGGGGGATH